MTITKPSQFLDVGFDISHHNGKLDFQRLWMEGNRRVCWLKLTEGTDFKDPMFKTYLQQMIDTGLDWKLAAYHFAHGDDPKGQVDFFLGTFQDIVSGMSGVPKFLFMLDCERGNNPPDEGVELDLVSAMAEAGISNPMSYGGYDFFSKKWNALGPVSCMLAEYGSHPISPLPWRRPDSIFGWDFWQYTGDGLGPWARDIPGGSNNMDLSCFNIGKHPEGLDAWWNAEIAVTNRVLSVTLS